MRVNQIYFSPKFQSFLNTASFVLMIVCFLLTLLLPMPYEGEPAGAISLQKNPELAPPIIVICVVIPFLLGIIFYLVFRITYIKSIDEVKSEFQENVSFNLIDTETVFKWENQVEEFNASKVLKKAETEKKKQEHILKLKKMEEKLKQEEEKLRKEIEVLRGKENEN